ncbi:ribokinase [Companilactobacillus bobalius]|nr:ribokinase [Companilactobacillus bobalius]KAE9561624.1 ribokinase [Companilactobacillus bobalius]OVE98237.1 Sulfofructose kinase [Companilactobacillus bobalius]GEO58798.1 ribokinase [Companilactobacillus paralimentarius]
MKKIVVLGSINVDTILNIPRLPLPGETMAMGDQSTAGGGKGANQAIAAVRAGAETTFIAKVGKDHSADFMLDTFKKDGLKTDHITVDSKAGTGKAYILLDEKGQNSILIYGGANQTITVDDVENARDAIENADCLISQFETPLAATLAAFQIAKKNNVVTILNPAPAKTDIIVPNETEAGAITGIKTVDRKSIINSAIKLNKMGIKRVIITVGSRGSLYYTDGKESFVDAYKVSAVDTTAAGDTFIGYLAAKLDSDLANMVEAMRFASKASSMAVQVKGAQNSIPYVDDVKI